MLWFQVAASDTTALDQACWPLPIRQDKGLRKAHGRKCCLQGKKELSLGAEALCLSAVCKMRVTHSPL